MHELTHQAHAKPPNQSCGCTETDSSKQRTNGSIRQKEKQVQRNQTCKRASFHEVFRRRARQCGRHNPCYLFFREKHDRIKIDGRKNHLSSTTFAKGRPSLARVALMGCCSSTDRISSLNSETSFAVIAAAE